MATDTPPAWHALFDALGGRAELAKRCAVSESTIWRWSRGEVTPSALVRSAVNALCDELDVERVFEDERNVSNA